MQRVFAAEERQSHSSERVGTAVVWGCVLVGYLVLGRTLGCSIGSPYMVFETSRGVNLDL